MNLENPCEEAVKPLSMLFWNAVQNLFPLASWYEYLFNQLDVSFEDFNQNQLRILTFNYDRSLEHFLFTALKNSSGKSEDECAEKLKSIPIIHLHGDLGALPHTGNDLARPYNTDTTAMALNIATKRIKIIHEGIANEPQFQQAQIILSKSEVICFLGFGYHPLNMERLGAENCRIGPLASKQIIGSSFGLTDAESNQISHRHRFNLRPSRYAYQHLDVLQFLRELGVLHGNWLSFSSALAFPLPLKQFGFQALTKRKERIKNYGT